MYYIATKQYPSFRYNSQTIQHFIVCRLADVCSIKTKWLEYSIFYGKWEKHYYFRLNDNNNNIPQFQTECVTSLTSYQSDLDGTRHGNQKKEMEQMGRKTVGNIHINDRKMMRERERE